MSVTLVLSGLSVVPFGVLQRDFRQSTQMTIDAVNLVVGTVVTVALVLLGLGAMSLAISRVAAQGLSTVMQYVAVRLRPRFGFDRQMARELVRFGLPLALSNLVSWLAMSVGQTTVTMTSGSTTLAYYVLAFNISMWPMTGLGVVVRSVALPAFSRLDDTRTTILGVRGGIGTGLGNRPSRSHRAQCARSRADSAGVRRELARERRRHGWAPPRRCHPHPVRPRCNLPDRAWS